MRGTPKCEKSGYGIDRGDFDRADAILVIDDDLMNAQLFSEIGELTGWSVFTAQDGEVGLGKAREIRPDVILLDLMMPNMDGFAVLANLRRDPELSRIPVLVVTAIDEEGSSDRARHLGAVDYIRKPFSVVALKERITQVLEVSHERRRTFDFARGGAFQDESGAAEALREVKGQSLDGNARCVDYESESSELECFIESRALKREGGDVTYSLLLAGLSINGSPVEESKDRKWLAETILMFTRRPQWMFRLDRGEVALYMTGLGGTAVIESAYNLHAALQKGVFDSDNPRRPKVHVACCPGFSFDDDPGKCIRKARFSLDKARRSRTDVIVWERNL